MTEELQFKDTSLKSEHVSSENGLELCMSSFLTLNTAFEDLTREPNTSSASQPLTQLVLTRLLFPRTESSLDRQFIPHLNLEIFLSRTRLSLLFHLDGTLPNPMVVLKSVVTLLRNTTKEHELHPRILNRSLRSFGLKFSDMKSDLMRQLLKTWIPRRTSNSEFLLLTKPERGPASSLMSTVLSRP